MKIAVCRKNYYYYYWDWPNAMTDTKTAEIFFMRIKIFIRRIRWVSWDSKRWFQKWDLTTTSIAKIIRTSNERLQCGRPGRPNNIHWNTRVLYWWIPAEENATSTGKRRRRHSCPDREYSHKFGIFGVMLRVTSNRMVRVAWHHVGTSVAHEQWFLFEHHITTLYSSIGHFAIVTHRFHLKYFIVLPFRFEWPIKSKFLLRRREM